MEIFYCIIYCIIYPFWTVITAFAWSSYLIANDDSNEPEDIRLKRNILMGCIIITMIDILLMIGSMKHFL